MLLKILGTFRVRDLYFFQKQFYLKWEEKKNKNRPDDFAKILRVTGKPFLRVGSDDADRTGNRTRFSPGRAL